MLIGIGDDCPKCGRKMERRAHGPNETKHLKKMYYYSQWDVCSSCRYIQHCEKFKVYPPKISVARSHSIDADGNCNLGCC